MILRHRSNTPPHGRCATRDCYRGLTWPSPFGALSSARGCSVPTKVQGVPSRCWMGTRSNSGKQKKKSLRPPHRGSRAVCHCHDSKRKRRRRKKKRRLSVFWEARHAQLVRRQERECPQKQVWLTFHCGRFDPLSTLSFHVFFRQCRHGVWAALRVP